MGRRVRQPQPVPLMPLLFLILGVFGAIAGVLRGTTLLLYGSVLCLVLAYVSYTRREVLEDLLSGLPETPTRLLLLLAVVAILFGVFLWSIRLKELIGDGAFVRVIHPYSSQAIGLVSLGLITIVIALAVKVRPRQV